MIEVSIYNTGFFIDKPSKKTILLSEEDVALEKKNEATNKLEKKTVGQIFDLWSKQADYIKDASDPEDQLSADIFPIYVFEKYIKGKPGSNSITKIEYKRIS